MNDYSVNGFTFFNNYYALIKNLPEDDGNKLMRGILAYMFEDVEPEFDGLLKAIFDTIKASLDTSKIRSKASKRVPNNSENVDTTPVIETNGNQNENKTKSNEKQNEIKKETNGNQNENKTKSNEKQNSISDLSYSYSYSNSLSTLGKGGMGEKPFPAKEKLPSSSEVEQVVEKWNSIGLAQVRTPLSKGRASKVKSRIKEVGLETVLEGIGKIPLSKFLMGDNKQGWRCTFDWLFTNDTNLNKVLEGNYLDHDVGAGTTSNPFIKSILREKEQA